MAGNFCEIIRSLPLDTIVRVDIGLEGDWSPTASTVWTRERGFIGFANVVRSHPIFRPSIELCTQDVWIGCHCFFSESGVHYFAEQYAGEIIRSVEGGHRPPEHRE